MEKEMIEFVGDRNHKEIYVHLFPFRAVLPYSHKYQTFAKSRWYGKPLLETLVKEFKAYDQAYYKSAVEEGRITMNGKKVPTDYLIRNGDKLIHSAVREQPPILDLEIEIVEDNQDYLVVNKPPSFTVHTGGGFHYNTLSSILQIQKGFTNLWVLHRLDRLTSGLIIFGKSKQKPQIFHKQSQNEQMKKMYFARVSGNFSWTEKTLSAEIECVSHKDGLYKVTRQIEENKQDPSQKQAQVKNELKELQAKEEKQTRKETKIKNKPKKKEGTNPDLKDSKTCFKKVFYDEDSDSSLVECYPISGRTHQIRVHLQYLGFPILNDVVYGGRFVGNNIIRLIKQNQSNPTQRKKLQKNEEGQLQNHGLKKIKTVVDNVEIQTKIMYQNCNQAINRQYTDSQTDLLKNQQVKKLKQRLQNEWDIKTKPWEICLHSYQYKLEGKTYKTEKPYWAHPGFSLKH